MSNSMEKYQHLKSLGLIKSVKLLFIESDAFKVQKAINQMQGVDRFSHSNIHLDNTDDIVKTFLNSLYDNLKNSIKEDIVTDTEDENDKKLALLGQEFISAIKEFDLDFFEEYLEQGLPVDVQDVNTLMTPIHLTALWSETMTNQLLEQKPDLTLQDLKGRFACECAATAFQLSEEAIENLFALTAEQLMGKHQMTFEDVCQEQRERSEQGLSLKIF